MNNAQTINHIAFIMDGNRRWAHSKNIPKLKGHEKGYENLIQIGELCIKKNIPYVTVYALSNENLKRSKEEVEYLFKLLTRALKEGLYRFDKLGLKLNIIGRWQDLPISLSNACKEAMEKTKKNLKGVLNIAINYSGRDEIVDAAKRAEKENGGVESKKDISDFLNTNGSPDPDLLVRTSGEQRLSGFLLWQLAYAELYFTPTFWPDFDERELDKAIDWYNNRDRRYGK